MAITSFNSVGGFSVNDSGVDVIDANANVYGNLVTANIFSGDGGLLSNLQYANVQGAYGNADVSAYLETNTSDLAAGNISVSGGVTGAFIYGNGAYLSGLPAGYTDGDVANLLSSGNITTAVITGDLTANYLIGDGSNITGIPYSSIVDAYGNTNVADYLATNTGNIVGASLSVSGNVTSNGQISAHRLFAGTEDEPVLVDHSAVTTRAFISSIGAGYGSEMMLHRHSTTQPVTLYGVLSNSDTSSDGVVSNGMDLFSVTGAGWTGNTYQTFAGISFLVDGANVADTSSPGAIHFWTTPSGSNAASNVMSLNNAGNLSVTGTIISNSNISGSYLLGNASAVTGLATVAHTGDYANLANAPTIPTALSQLTNDANLVTWANVQSELPSYSGNLGGTLTSPAQPHITSVGQLGSLDIAAGLTIGTTLSVAGNTTVNNLFVTGNVDMPGNITVINANSYFSVGDSSGFGALFAGLATGFANLDFTVAEFSADNNEYAQINFQNINGGNMATTDYVATADNGTNSTYFVDLGIASSNFDGNGPNIIGSMVGPNDSYLYAVGQDSANVGGNLIIGAATETRSVYIVAGGGGPENLLADFNETGITFQANINANSTITAISFTGDGSGLTGIFSNATLANVGSNAISTTGNIAGAYFIGDGSQLTGLPASYGNSDVAAYLPVYTGNIKASLFSSTGNITGNNIVSTRVVVRAVGPSSTNVLDGGPGNVFATLVVDCNTTDQMNYTGGYDQISLSNPTGTPFDGQKMTFRLKNTIAATLSFDSNYRAIGTTLPTALVANKYVYIGLIYNAEVAYWDVVSVATQA